MSAEMFSENSTAEVMAFDRANIAGQVFSELDATPGVDAHLIGIRYLEGVVTLAGPVRGEYERMAAGAAAFRVEGVRTVDDRLSVDGEQYQLIDAGLAPRVEQALAASGLDRQLVRTELRRSIVSVSGQVEPGQERGALVACIEAVDGVLEVIDNRLAARPS